MAAWPRTVLPQKNTEPSVPGSFRSIALSGKPNVRSGAQVGRIWSETYLVNVRNVDSRALVATARTYLRSGTSFTIIHQDHATPLGAYGGTPLVAGASQTGPTINLDGASNSITNWARAGDIVSFAGLAIVYEVTADTNSDGSGLVALPITPPIFSGNSPANNAALTTTSVTMTCIVIDVDYPDTGANNYGVLKVTFQEAN